MNLFASPWKAATIVAGVLNLVIGGFLVYSQLENRMIAQQRDKFEQSITDPVVGYIARLTQAQNNVVTLKAEIAKQNTALRTLSAESAARLAETKRQLAIQQRETARLQTRINSFLAQKIEGKTLEERVLDVDERAMKEFLE